MKKRRLLPIGTLPGASCAGLIVLIAFVVYVVLTGGISDLISENADRSWPFVIGLLAALLAVSIVASIVFSIVSIAVIYPALRLMGRLEAHGEVSAGWAYAIAGTVAGSLLAYVLLLIFTVFFGPSNTPERPIVFLAVVFCASTIAAWTTRRRHARKEEERMVNVFAP